MLLCSAISIFFNLIFNDRRIDDRIAIAWARISCWMFGVEVEIKNKEIWSRPGGAVILFNHTSFFDIFALMGYLPGIRFGAKIELFKIPIFGMAMRRIGILPIDRGAREKTMKIYEQSIARLRAGERVALAPEGTRNDEGGLKPFKGGPFVFALQSQVQIIPVIIEGAAQILPKHTLIPNLDSWKKKIVVNLLEPISTEGKTPEDKKPFQELVYSRMSAAMK